MSFPNLHIKTAIAAYSSFATLGVYRGVSSYNYDFKANTRMGNIKTYLYTSAAFRGGVYGILYISPIVNLFIISKELYRLEVNLRGIKEEMDTSLYYELF